MKKTAKLVLDEARENYLMGLISLNEYLDIQRKVNNIKIVTK